ncbi:MAG: hypothetical protein H5U02_13540, partial [Clostridia bacterium]|nr:hypothetical protein [Clostridia bacterium]
KIQVIATRSCFKHFYSTFTDSKECIKDVVLLLPGKQEELRVVGGNFTIRPIPAYHQDLGEGDCAGLVIEVNDKHGQESHEFKSILGMTGDTVWTTTLARDLAECAVVCMNMGALIDVRKGASFEEFFCDPGAVKKLIYEQNHLYLPGTLTLLQELSQKGRAQLAVIGELGEELKSGLREDLFYSINDFLTRLGTCHKRTPIKALMEDIGLTISWEQGSGEPQVRCARCKRPFPATEVQLKVTEDERKSEQLNYYCPDCKDKIEWLEKGDDEKWKRRYWPRVAR